MSFDYDTLDTAPTTAVEVSQATVFSVDRVWENFSMRVPVDPSRVLFTRAGGVGSSDLKTYDFGRFFVSAEGCDDTTNQGYILVEYEIELFDKQNSSSATSGAGDFAIWNLSAAQSASNTTVTVAFDEEPVTNDLVLANTSGTFTVPISGVYEIHCDINTTAALLGTTPSTLEVDDAAVAPPILFSGTNTGGHSATLSACILELNAGQTFRIRVNGATSCQLDGDGCRILVKLLSLSA